MNYHYYVDSLIEHYSLFYLVKPQIYLIRESDGIFDPRKVFKLKKGKSYLFRVQTISEIESGLFPMSIHINSNIINKDERSRPQYCQHLLPYRNRTQVLLRGPLPIPCPLCSSPRLPRLHLRIIQSMQNPSIQQIVSWKSSSQQPRTEHSLHDLWSYWIYQLFVLRSHSSLLRVQHCRVHQA